MCTKANGYEMMVMTMMIGHESAKLYLTIDEVGTRWWKQQSLTCTVESGKGDKWNNTWSSKNKTKQKTYRHSENGVYMFLCWSTIVPRGVIVRQSFVDAKEIYIVMVIDLNAKHVRT